jgi:hypothetical protein
VARLVEIERRGAVVCPTGYGVADEPFNSATHRASAMPGFGASGESGFTGMGRVHIARPFILISLSSRGQPARRARTAIGANGPASDFLGG